jgi:dihydroorotate dehydrogenase (NAD+) catalytic subunit
VAVKEVDLSVDLAPCNRRNLKLTNPVMIASGTFGYDGYGRGISPEMDLGLLGAVVPKTVTRWSLDGNPEPRWYPESYRVGVEQGECIFLNSVGLDNPGIETALGQLALQWKEWNTTIVLSLSGETIAQFGEMAAMSQGVEGIQALELNLSCPNIENGAFFSHNATLTAEVVSAVTSNTDLPVLVKLAPNVPDVTEIALAAVSGGADALTMCNTMPAMGMDIDARRPILGGILGGLSGPGLRAISLAMVYRTAQVVDVPIIGVGGIFNAKHVVEFILAGATAVQVGSANLANLWAPFQILNELRSYLGDSGVNNISDLIGAGQVSGPR